MAIRLIKEANDLITALDMEQMKKKLKVHGYDLDSWDFDDQYLYLTKSGDPYDTKFYRNKSGKYGVYLDDIHPTKTKRESIKRLKERHPDSLKKYNVIWHVKDNSETYAFSDETIVFARNEEEAVEAAFDEIVDKNEYSLSAIDWYDVEEAEEDFEESRNINTNKHRLIREDKDTEVYYRLSGIEDLQTNLKILTKKVNLLLGAKDNFNAHVENNVKSARNHIYEALQDLNRAMNATTLGR